MPDTKLDPNKFTQPQMEKKTHQARWWQLYFIFSPGKLGKMNPSWLAHIFFRWVGKNHQAQPAKIFPPFFGVTDQLSVFWMSFRWLKPHAFGWFFLSGFYPSVAAFSVDPFERFEVLSFDFWNFVQKADWCFEGMNVLHCIIWWWWWWWWCWWWWGGQWYIT